MITIFGIIEPNRHYYRIRQSVWVAQTGNTGVLKGKVRNEETLESLVTTAWGVYGTEKEEDIRCGLFLLIIILGIMEGYVSYRAFGDFAKYI